MAAFMAISSLSILAVLSLTASLCAGQVGLGDNPTCGTTYNETSGRIRYNNGSSINVPENVTKCEWHIASLSSHSIFLVFDHLYLMEGDEIRISANGSDLALFNSINWTNVVGALPCLTGKSNITVSLTTTKFKPNNTRTLEMHYYTNCTDCSHVFDPVRSGVLHSPLYNPNSTTFPTTVSLTIPLLDKDLHTVALWFEDFMFKNGGVSLTGTTHDGTYNASNMPVMEFLANNGVDIKVSLTNVTKEPESFVAKYDTVSKICGGDVKVADKPVSVNSPPVESLQYLLASNEDEVNCHWLVWTDVGKTLSVTDLNVSLPEAQSQLVILDGPNRTSPLLFDMNSQGHNELQAVFSSGNYLWISASAPSVSKDFKVDLQVSQTKNGGHMREKGQLKANEEDKSVFLLDAGPNKQVQLVLSNATVLKDDGAVRFYKDFLTSTKPFLIVTKQNKTDVVESPTGQMAVVTSGFKTSTLDASFNGVDEGCFKYGDGDSGTFSVTGHCNSSCGWMIQPVPGHPGLFAFHFQSLNLKGKDKVIIRMMDANQTQVADISAPTSQLPDLLLPAATGTFVQVTRSDCSPDSTVIQSNYQTSPSCAATYTPGVGDNVTISSVGYPNHYPLGGSCTWNVSKPNASVFLYVSFVDLQLAKDDHIVQLYEVNGNQTTLRFKSNGTGKELPADLQIRGDLMVTFSAKVQVPLQSLPGFKLTVSAVGMGDDLRNSTGKIETPDFPKPVNGTALYVWSVEVNSPVTERQIIELSFQNSTKISELEQNLKIYDGGSLHAAAITNFTSPTILSRTNQLLFVYQSNGSTPGIAFTVSYRNHSCNMSMLCDNNICMHDDWHCNGINECGDFSDEKNCNGGPPPPPSPAPPVPPPSDGSKGVSTAALAVGILIALVIGAILGVGAPAAFRKLRGNRFQSYSSFTNNIE